MHETIRRYTVQGLAAAMFACLSFRCDCQMDGGLRNLRVQDGPQVDVWCASNTALHGFRELRETCGRRCRLLKTCMLEYMSAASYAMQCREQSAEECNSGRITVCFTTYTSRLLQTALSMFRKSRTRGGVL